MPDFDPKEFLHDFFLEADDHLQSIKQNLLQLEVLLSPDHTKLDETATRLSLLEELLRSFHTLKGLTSMVGLEQAPELSHAMETVLKGIQGTQVELTQETIDLLLQGSRSIEAMVRTLRDPEAPQPDTKAILIAIQPFLPKTSGEKQPAGIKPSIPEGGQISKGSGRPSPHSSTPAFLNLPEWLSWKLSLVEDARTRAAQESNQILSLAVFRPSAEKSDRGENVNYIRQKLSQAAEIIKAAPVVEGNNVRFAFLLASSSQLHQADFPEVELQTLEALPQVVESQAVVSAPEWQAPAAVSNVMTPKVRIDLAVLDDMLRLVSDLIIDRYRLVDLVGHLNGAAQTKDLAAQVLVRIERHLRSLRQATLHARMVPLSEVFRHMPLAIRDLSRSYGKEVHLILEGEATEIDRVLVEKLLDPLLHLIRNAIVHGIETPEERRQAGKPTAGSLTLRGLTQGDYVLVQVSDDGRGIDAEKIVARAAALGLETYQAGSLGSGSRSTGETLTHAEILQILCRPGFTTSQEADLRSGRGMGMDIVNSAVKAMGGTLHLQSTPGQDTTFTMRLPVTLTILNAFLVGVGQERYAIPLEPVQRLIEITPAEIVRVESGELVPYDDHSISLLRLEKVFHLSGQAPKTYQYGLVIEHEEYRFALVVDRLLGMREVVFRPSADPLVAQPGILGATELGDGSVILIINVLDLYEYWQAQGPSKERKHA